MSPRHTTLTAEPETPLARVVERNIEALRARRAADDHARGRQEKAADRISQFTGSMTFVYIHLVLFGTWIVWNVGWLPLRPFDPQFTVLAMAASAEAIFLSTFVLITQNRMQQLADSRADLDLQVSLLSEHEVTRLIQLTAAIARRMGIEEGNHPELPELARDVRPEKVLDEIEESSRRDSARGAGESSEHDRAAARAD
jgi:uncharacterized membrane protein